MDGVVDGDTLTITIPVVPSMIGRRVTAWVPSSDTHYAGVIKL